MVRGRRDLWLNLESLLGSMLDPARRQSLAAVRYFTAPVVGPGADRQQTYLDALVEHGRCTTVWLGRFQRKHRRCASCGTRWVDRLPSRHQLPDVVTAPDGRWLQRPAYWSA